jgi:membrane protease YdiL (CAAX protease family)
MSSVSINSKQLKKGLVILALFIILRAIIANLSDVNSETQETWQRIVFLGGGFLILSVGLVYFGFSRWVGVDLRKWWQFDKRRLPGDIGWGVVGFLLGFFINVGVIIFSSQMGLIPQEVTSAQPVQLTLIDWLSNIFFGFAIASFQEETIFRGFLFDALHERFNTFWSVIFQALIFSVAHIGYYPLDRWILFILAFFLGIVYGALRAKRGSVIAAWISHGLIG